MRRIPEVLTMLAALLLPAFFLPSPALGQWALRDMLSGFEPRPNAPLFAPGQLLVKFPEATSVVDIQRAASEMGGTLVEMVTPDGLAKVRLDPSADVKDAVRQWSRRPGVEYAVPNLIAHTFTVPNDSLLATFDLGWNLRQIGAYDAWDFVTADPRIVIAIVDTGVAFEDYAIPAYELPVHLARNHDVSPLAGASGAVRARVGLRVR